MAQWDDEFGDNEEIIEEEIVEGVWFCPNCNTENAGSNMRCGGCGQTRENVEFVYDPEAEKITDEAELAEAAKGPDWVCNFCGTSNKNEEKRCKQCGADFDGEFRQVNDVPLEDTNIKKEDAQGVAAAREDADAVARYEENEEKAEKSKGCPCSCCSTFLFAFIALFIGWLLPEPTYLVTARQWQRTVSVERSSIETAAAWEGEVPRDGREISRSNIVYRHKKVQVGTKPVPRFVKERKEVSKQFLQGFTVAHRSWSRTIKLEKRSYKKGSAWEGRLPSGAQELSRNREVYDHENFRRSRQVSRRVPHRVPDGYTRELVRVKNLGNGRFKKIYKKKRKYRTEYRSETKTEYYNERKPIYRDKIRYKLTIWSHSRTLETTGDYEQSPIWPTTNLHFDEREKRRIGVYRVRLDSSDKKTRYTHYAASAEEYGSYHHGLTDSRIENAEGVSHPFDYIYSKLPSMQTVEVEKIFDEPVYEMQPIYRNRIVFEFDKWTKVRTEETKGSDGEVPMWPEVNLAANERRAKRAEKYSIKLTSDDGEIKYGYFTDSQSEYAKLKMGTKCRLKKMKSAQTIKELEIIE